MPYVIRTGPDGFDTRYHTRRVVATLEEAQEVCCEIIDAIPGIEDEHRHDPELQPAYRLSESGGTVGPLPDGTTIEVESISWARIANAAAKSPWPESRQHRADIIDAYNARQLAER